MSPYYISDTADEYCTLPDPTYPQQAALIGYLLVEGPLDGTGLAGVANPEPVSDAVESRKQTEREQEATRFETYVREQPDDVTAKFERKYEGFIPQHCDYQSLPAFKRFCAQEAQSIYRNDDGTWDEARLTVVAAAGLSISTAFSYLGRWSDDTVRIASNSTFEDRQAYHDITGGLVNEATRVLPSSFVENGEYVLTPDAVITRDDDDGGNSTDSPTPGTDGNSQRLFPNTG